MEIRLLSQTYLAGLLTLSGIAIAPDPALAVPEPINLTLTADHIQSYSILTTQALQMARDAIAQTFNHNPTADSVHLVITVDRNGQILPLLSVQMQREQWQQTPDKLAWSRYSTSNRILLGYAPISDPIPTAVLNPRFTPSQQRLIEEIAAQQDRD